jgi:hypothetical protein
MFLVLMIASTLNYRMKVVAVREWSDTCFAISFIFAIVRQRLRPQDLWVDANDEDSLVIRAVENGDLAALRQIASGAPKEIVS